MTIVLQPFNVSEEEADHICAQRDFCSASMKQKEIAEISNIDFPHLTLLLLITLLRDLLQRCLALIPHTRRNAIVLTIPAIDALIQVPGKDKSEARGFSLTATATMPEENVVENGRGCVPI